MNFTPSPTMLKSWPPPDNNDTPPTSIKRPSLHLSDVIPKKSRITNNFKPPNTIIFNKTKKVDMDHLPKSTSERYVVVAHADAYKKPEGNQNSCFMHNTLSIEKVHIQEKSNNTPLLTSSKIFAKSSIPKQSSQIRNKEILKESTHLTETYLSNLWKKF